MSENDASDPKPPVNDRGGLYLMVGFLGLLIAIVIFGYLTNPP